MSGIKMAGRVDFLIEQTGFIVVPKSHMDWLTPGNYKFTPSLVDELRKFSLKDMWLVVSFNVSVA